LLAKWHSLPQDKQEEVLDFVEFLHLKNSVNKTPWENVCGLQMAIMMPSGNGGNLCLSWLP